jgi:uncharacterized protein
MKNNAFYQAVLDRRSIYDLLDTPVLSDDELIEKIGYALKHTPTAFNSQSDRVVVLLGDAHHKLWDMTKEILRQIVPQDAFASTEAKMESFRKAYGTILYFEDRDIVTGLQQQFPLYKDNFPIWSQQQNGMLQYVIWTTLTVEGYGASLQHYNPLIDEAIAKEWNIPASWKLTAQMPFGTIGQPADEKSFNPLEERLVIHR